MTLQALHRIWQDAKRKGIRGFRKAQPHCCATCLHMNIEQQACEYYNLDFTSEDYSAYIENVYEYICDRWCNFASTPHTTDTTLSN